MNYVPSQWIKWHPRGHLVLAGSEDCTVWMWNADKGACLQTFSGHGGSVTCGDFTPDGSQLLFFLVLFWLKNLYYSHYFIFFPLYLPCCFR